MINEMQRTIQHIETVRGFVNACIEEILKESQKYTFDSSHPLQNGIPKEHEMSLFDLLTINCRWEHHNRAEYAQFIQSEIKCRELQQISLNTNDLVNKFHESNLNHFHALAIFLMREGQIHDQSKLQPPEIEAFATSNDLKKVTYGTHEYNEHRNTHLNSALKHHYQNNRHHPEHFGEQGILGMTHADMIVMISDWMASTLRHSNGDIRRSIEIVGQERFRYSDTIKLILLNTATRIKALPIQHRAYR
ncbi:DUF5662 family protein [Patescibacteria group bacterium]